MFQRPVQVVTDFEKSIMNALSQYAAGQSLVCCFFHFAANIRKRSTPIMTAIKRAAGENAAMLRLAEKTKRAVMMLPFLPAELIDPAIVAAIFGRWTAAYEDHRNDFDELRDHVLDNYVRPGARFPVRFWSVSGRRVRTNNAAESSHSRLNASVRVSGAVTLDMFLNAIEIEMRNTSREIAAACQPHG